MTVVKPVGNPVGTPALRNRFMIDFFDDLAFLFVNYEISNRLILLVGSAQMLKPISKWNEATSVQAFLYHLKMFGTDAHGCLFAFAGSLPKSDVVQQFVHMAVESLLAFFGTPNFDAVFYKPLNHERCFIIAPAYAVKHEHK